jgi:hypothetical protein
MRRDADKRMSTCNSSVLKFLAGPRTWHSGLSSPSQTSNSVVEAASSAACGVVDSSPSRTLDDGPTLTNGAAKINLCSSGGSLRSSVEISSHSENKNSKIHNPRG